MNADGVKKMEEKERMNEMIETIMKVARGDYSVQIEVSDENADIDSLGIGLNMMIDDEGKVNIDVDDEIVQHTCITRDGTIVNERLK